MRSQDLRPGARALSCPLPPCYATNSNLNSYLLQSLLLTGFSNLTLTDPKARSTLDVHSPA